MSRIEPLLADLADAVDDERPAAVGSTAHAIREAVAEALADRRLGPEDPLLADRRRLHHRLEVLEAKAEAGRFDDAREDLGDVDEMARTLAADIEAREPADEAAGDRSRWMPFATVARRQARAHRREGLVLAVLVGLVLGLGLQSASPLAGTSLAQAWTDVLGPLLAVAALGGTALAAGVLARDRRADRLPLVVGHGASRVGVVVATFAGLAAVATAALAGPFVLVSLLGLAAGVGLGGSWPFAALAGLVVTALAFATVVLALEARGATARGSLTAGAVVYLVTGPIWQAAFEAGAASGRPDVAVEMVNLVSPVAAAGHASTPGGSQARVVAGLLVLVGWTVAALGAGLWFAHRGFPPRRDER